MTRRAAPRTDPPGKRSFPPKFITKPELRNEGKKERRERREKGIGPERSGLLCSLRSFAAKHLPSRRRRPDRPPATFTKTAQWGLPLIPFWGRRA